MILNVLKCINFYSFCLLYRLINVCICLYYIILHDICFFSSFSVCLGLEVRLPTTAVFELCFISPPCSIKHLHSPLPLDPSLQCSHNPSKSLYNPPITAYINFSFSLPLSNVSVSTRCSSPVPSVCPNPL